MSGRTKKTSLRFVTKVSHRDDGFTDFYLVGLSRHKWLSDDRFDVRTSLNSSRCQLSAVDARAYKQQVVD